MYYTGKVNKIDWQGQAVPRDYRGNDGLNVELHAENDEGRVMFVFSVGRLIPENWHRKRVRITVELLDSSHDG